MKRYILLLPAVFISMTLCAQKTAKPVKDTSLMAKIAFDETLHDFGKIEREGSVTATFRFENRGKEPLVISSVKPRCGCTKATWSKEPVKHGKSGEIKVKYTPDHHGDFMNEVTVYSNSVTPELLLYVKGVIK
jgi:hypothetical protein